ncbi:F-box/kelch-repeat protein [Senna tora]|uniref:F-box/kelch-repeat protein n=1 Tax=Senna tora TaxID=362788 RepID=A0A834X010_9FABA|nr:F-box/kelch-repeat protein [Senna tora]
MKRTQPLLLSDVGVLQGKTFVLSLISRDYDSEQTMKALPSILVVLRHLRFILVIGIEEGVFCFYSFRSDHNHVFYLWNPNTFQLSDVIPPYSIGRANLIHFGFGIHRDSREFCIIVMWSYFDSDYNFSTLMSVFYASSCTWHPISKPILQHIQVLEDIIIHIDGTTFWSYWTMDDNLNHNLDIVSYNIASQTLNVVDAPCPDRDHVFCLVNVDGRPGCFTIQQVNDIHKRYILWMKYDILDKNLLWTQHIRIDDVPISFQFYRYFDGSNLAHLKKIYGRTPWPFTMLKLFSYFDTIKFW